MTATTVPAALAVALRGDSAAPFVTWIGTDGARSELSLRTYENNVAKAANLLRDDGDVGPGRRVSLHLPLHWQSAVWVGACGLVGGVAEVDGDPLDAEVSVVGPEGLDLPQAPLTLATSLHPFGTPFPATTALPAGVLDAAGEVRAHGDRFVPYDDVTGATPWLARRGRTWTQAQALADAEALAASLGLPEGGRLLVTGSAADDRALLALLAVPLALRGSVVLLSGAAPVGEVAAAERCDAVLVV